MRIARGACMSCDMRQSAEQGRLAFIAGVPQSGNPYSATAAAPLGARMLDLSWSHGWLLAQAADKLAETREAVAHARAVRSER
jgi:hypothetical protein